MKHTEEPLDPNITVMDEDYDTTCADCLRELQQAINDLVKDFDTLQAELAEQCKLHSTGGDREQKLREALLQARQLFIAIDQQTKAGSGLENLARIGINAIQRALHG